MADSKKAVTATAKPVAKAVAATTTETADVKAEVIKETEKKAPAKKAAPAAKKPATKKEAPVKKEAPAKKATAAKAEVSTTISFQFSGKEYKTEDLVKIAKDVWKYDLNKEAAEFKTVELYVKPEECLVYYVINGDVTGNFAI